MKQTQLSKNIYKDYIFTFFNSFNLTQGVWMLYLASKGLTLFQIGIMETIYHISSFSMEIPTGAIADIYGRKTSRILGRLALIVSALIMIYGNSVLLFGLSFFFTALSNNLESGAGEALIYDSLKEINKESLYSKIRGKNEMVYQMTSTFSLIIGGYIATKSYSSIYIVTFIIASFGLLHAFSFTEPTIGKIQRSHNFISTFKNQLKESITIVKNDKRIVEVVLILELFSTFYATEFFYLQNRLKEAGKTEFFIGIILSLGALIAAILGTQTYKFEKKFSLKSIITVLSITAICGFWLMSIPGVEIYALIVLSGVEGVLFVTLGDYINQLIPSERRATIISFQSMVFSFFMIILFPIVGKIGDLFGLSRSFLIIAIISTPTLIFMISTIQKGNHSK